MTKAGETQRHMLRKPSLLTVWSRVRDELALLQDRAPDEACGQVINPISGMVYAQNTACAALVFATEYVRTHENVWLIRSQRAVSALRGQGIHAGVDEPKWYRLGWENNRGSLFTTGTLLDSYWKALAILDQDDVECGMLDLMRYVGKCKIGDGLYAHDLIQPGHLPHAVQNTSAIALYLMEEVASRSKSLSPGTMRDRDASIQLLLKGQRKDGLWPYSYPGMRQQVVFHHKSLGFLRYIPFLRRSFFPGGDISIYFGDAVHHCLVLYYLMQSINLRSPAFPWRKWIMRGWMWVRHHLVSTEDDSVRFDFDWEPTPGGFRWGNFRDTSTYFLILAVLPLLERFGFVEDCEYISEGILNHVAQKLLDNIQFKTSIRPYEGSDTIVKYILPRVGEASAWKGALLADFLRYNSTMETD